MTLLSYILFFIGGIVGWMIGEYLFHCYVMRCVKK